MVRSRTYRNPLRLAWTSSLRGWPRQTVSINAGVCCASKSHTSCGVNWKCHFKAPVAASRATIELGIEIVAAAVVANEVGARIADRPVEQAELRIVGPGEPRGAARVVDRVALPGVRAGLAAARHGPEPPHFLAAGLVVGGNEPAHALVAARHARDHQAADRERRPGGAVVLPVVGHLRVPHEGAGRPVERDQMGVIGGHEHAVAGHGRAAVDAAGGVADHAARARALIPPDLAPVPASSA